MILDAHVHLRDGSQAYKETLRHAFWLCTRLGIRGLIEMPNTSPPLTKRPAILKRLELLELAVQGLREQGLTAPHYAMHIGLERNAKQIFEAVALHTEFFPLTAGLKMYAGHSTGDMGIVDDSAQHLVYRSLAEANYRGVLVVHCEAEELIDNSLFCVAEPTSHSRARPPVAEVRSIEQQLRLADGVGFQGHLHIAHISTPEGVALVQEAKKSRPRLSCGATPHHTMFSTEEQLRLGAEGNLLKMNPPLRAESSRTVLWDLLLNGQIDWIESDHAPHAAHEKLGLKLSLKLNKSLSESLDKNSGKQVIASGIPGLSGINLLYWQLQRAGMPTEQLAAISYRRALDIYELPWPLQDFASAPPELELENLCEVDGSPLYGGVDPYTRQAVLAAN